MFTWDIGPFLKESSLFPKEIGFSLGKSHVLKEKEFKLPQETI
jgi:hypothetical protein